MFAYVYARWSSQEQTKGSTLARQLSTCGEFVESKPDWTLAETITDKGTSAYTGDNIETGNLGKFRDRILNGTIDPTKAVLVCEELDRLSRQPADVMLSWLSPLVRRGLTIVVVNTGQTITREMLDVDMGGLMMILITAFGSHTESRKKAKRVAAAWEAKREAARSGKSVTRTHRHPKWITVQADGTFTVLPHHRLIVETIFKNRINGIGKGLTAKTLNALAQDDPAFAPWPVGMTGAAPALWTATYVGRVLRNRAVMGEWQPFTRPRKGAPAPAGEPITDYYPLVIDAATFARANEERIADALKHQGRGNNLSNLLGTRARCGECGGQMAARGSAAYFTNKKGEKRRHYFLYCQNAKSGGSCENQRGWTYDRVEVPILDTILSLAMDETHFDSGTNLAPIEAAIYTHKGTIADVEHKLANLLDLVESGNKGAAARYAQREAELEAARDALMEAENRLAEAKGRVSPTEHLRRVGEVRSLMWSDDQDVKFQARSKVKAALGDVIERITFHPITGNVSVMLVDRVRFFAIDHAGKVIDDMDLTKLGGGPGYGKVTTIENATLAVDENGDHILVSGDVTAVANDLNSDQEAASLAYMRRKALG